MIRAVMLLLAVAGSACSSTVTFVRTRSQYAVQARTPADVELFLSGPPKRDYVELGAIEIQQETALSVHGPEQLLARLRKRAAAEGCDAVIVAGPNDKIVGTSNYAYGSITTLKGYRGTCIAYDLASSQNQAPAVDPANDPPPPGRSPEQSAAASASGE